MMRGDHVARATAAAMQHQPDHAVFVLAQFEKMVAAAERAKLQRSLLLDDRRDRLGIACVVVEAFPFLDGTECCAETGRDHAPWSASWSSRRNDWDRSIARILNGCASIPQPMSTPDRRRQQRIGGRKDAADGRAQPIMHIGHGRDVMKDERASGERC